MQGKITLITPPDIFENRNPSILFVNLSEEDQTIISNYLVKQDLKHNYNFYLYNEEDNPAWLLYAANRTNWIYIDFNFRNSIVDVMGSYLISRSNVFYKSEDQNLASIYSHLNQNKITTIEKFLDRVFNDQTDQSSEM